MGCTWSLEPSYDMSTESCSATWWTWHWSDMDMSGWVLNVIKEINSLWGNKVGGFRLSWVCIIAWRKKEVRTGSGGCELRCWAIFLPTAQGEGGNGWAQSEWKGGLKETSFPLCCSPSQLLSFLVIGLTDELGCFLMGHLPRELASHWRASPCSPVKDPANWIGVGSGETVVGENQEGTVQRSPYSTFEITPQQKCLCVGASCHREASYCCFLSFFSPKLAFIARFISMVILEQLRSLLFIYFFSKCDTNHSSPQTKGVGREPVTLYSNTIVLRREA